MSLTVMIRTVDDDAQYEVELSGPDRVQDVYRKAAEATAVQEGRFLLHFEGAVLDGKSEIQQLGMGQGSELLLTYDSRATHIDYKKLRSSKKTLEKLIEEDPELLLAVDFSDGHLNSLESRFPSNLRHLKITGKSTSFIGNGFLVDSQLVTLDLAMTGIQSIGNRFLANCDSLATVKIGTSSTIKEVGSGFLSGCASLTCVDLTGLQVKSVGGSFLRNCRSLRTVDLTPLCNISIISNNFLRSCESLVSVDLSPFRHVRSVGEYFLSNCKSLETVELPPLHHVTIVHHSFLRSCESLTSVDLTTLVNVQSVDGSFLRNCKVLKTVDLTPLSNVATIGDYFLASCVSLTCVDLSPFEYTQAVGGSFLYNCTSLETVDRGPIRSALGKTPKPTRAASRTREHAVHPQQVRPAPSHHPPVKQACCKKAECCIVC
eukprot:TRINITY_DN9930_c0_g1_i1.p1 TRINITY_DN9930_c0_g1~~TRINITY_DN9930_c0_g1_i1.p1  ORF type:complete len:449 (+),score=73.53 TRINITY_DN9930_c0_g1_i1:57-1349(+)